MAKRLFVGSLPYEITNNELEELFGQVGPVASVSVITDRMTGRPKGFAFVEMADDAAADEAIAKLNGATVGGRTIVVNEARPKEDRPRTGGGFGGGDRGGRGGFGGGRGGFGGGDRGGRRW